jgi:hypothetical protein
MINSQNETSLNAIRSDLAAQKRLSATQLIELRKIANNKNSETSEAAMAVLKLDPWATQISASDVQWLERLFDESSNDQTKAYSLQILCDYLHTGLAQKQRLLKSMTGTADKHWNLVIQAASSAGTVLCADPDHALLTALLDIMRNDLPGTRATARDAILRASGMTSREVGLARNSGGEEQLWPKAEAEAAKMLAV